MKAYPTSTIRSQIVSLQRHNLYVIEGNNRFLNDAIAICNKEGIPVLNMGRSLSEHLSHLSSLKYIHMEAEDYIRQSLSGLVLDDAFHEPKVMAIHNLGILLEPALGLNPSILLKELSKSMAIIIIWDGEMEKRGILHWKSDVNKYFLDFSEVHLTSITLPYEI